MNKRKFWLALCLVTGLTVVLLVSGCATKPTPAPAPPASPKASPAPAAASAPKPAPASVAKPAPAPAPVLTLEKQLYEAAKKEGKLYWWESQSSEAAAATIEAFNKLYPGIKVEYWQATADVRDQKITAEQTARQYNVDVTSTSTGYPVFVEKGWLTNITDVVNDVGYPKEFVTPDGTGVTVLHFVNSCAYNTKLVAPQDVPKTWADLLDPKWKGKIDVEARMQYHVFATGAKGMSESENVEYLKKLAKQELRFSHGRTEGVGLLAAGEFPIFVSADLYVCIQQKAKGANVDFLPLLPLSHKHNPHFIMKTAPHPNAAKLFLRFLLSPAGQEIVDKVSLQANPLAGAGTLQSKWIESHGIKATDIYTVQTWKVDVARLTKVYQDAIGFKK